MWLVSENTISDSQPEYFLSSALTVVTLFFVLNFYYLFIKQRLMHRVSVEETNRRCGLRDCL